MSFARRTFLQSVFGGSALLGVAGASAATPPRASEASPLKVAFLTDTHLPAGNDRTSERVAGLIDAIQSRAGAPDLFLFGGDNVMAVDGGQSDADTEDQFRRWKTQVRDRLKTPSLSCIGNHDIRWKERSKEKPEAFLEKARAIDAYNMPARYFSADQGGWTFILLDVYQATGCELDEPQWKWLEAKLADGESPACIVTHAPLFSATHFLEPSTDTGKGYAVPAGWSPQGLVRFRELFRKHPRVKLCLSGHMHTCDRVDIDQTSYVCGGAVSGNWWGAGNYLGFGPCWIELELHADGRWTHERREWA